VLRDVVAYPVPVHRSWIRLRRLLLRRKLVVVALASIVFVVALALLAPWVAPHDPYNVDLAASLQDPSARHWLGTDQLGRDVLSRLIFGARVALLVGVVTVSVSCLVGSLLGLAAGYFGRLADNLIMRTIEALMSLPPLVLALAIGVAMGGGLETVIIALSVAMIPAYTRLLRGQVMAVKHMDYVTAAVASGASDFRIMFLHVLPNCLSPLIVEASIGLGFAILAESALSFLGLGVAPPQPSWGEMISDGYRYLRTHPLLSIAPGLCISLLVLACNIIGDTARDVFDPRLRQGL